MRRTEVTVTMTTSKMDRGKELAKKTETRMIWHTHMLFLITQGKRRVEGRRKSLSMISRQGQGFSCLPPLACIKFLSISHLCPKLAVSDSAVKLMTDVVLKCLMFNISFKCHHVPGISNHIAKSFINLTIFFFRFYTDLAWQTQRPSVEVSENPQISGYLEHTD